MRERIAQSKKASTDSSSIPSLKQLTRGFGESSLSSTPAVPSVQPLNKPLGHDISRIPVHRPQTKLSISQPGDEFEKQADVIAKKVMSNKGTLEQTHSQVPSQPLAARITPLVQQHQAMPQSAGGLQATSDFESRLKKAKAGGSPLPSDVQTFVEGGLGVDFSNVRAHTDSESVQMNKEMHSEAFANENHIFYGEGNSPKKDFLTLHEGVHTVQQSGGTVQRSPQQAADFAAISNHGGTTSPEIQLYSAMEASELIENKYKEWKQWYYEVCVPAMQTIAAKEGQDFNQYLATKSQGEFEQAMKALHTEAKDERYSLKDMSRQLFSTGNSLVESDNYPTMNRVSGTNILVHKPENLNNTDLQKFISLYKSGNMTWYRGLSISHFSYKQLQLMGVLGSEGTADIPTFTMGNASPSRWLPGIYEPGLAESIAHGVSSEDAGIRDIISRKDIPIGVTVQYPITPPAHVAFLNDGEQVIRGPIRGTTVYRVVLLGPGGYSYRLANGSTNDLPPAAPYRAGVGSPEIVAWENDIDAWLLRHP